MNSWCVYLLVSESGRTYIGSTTDPVRRLRQHNRELVGGAKATASEAPRWKLICWISGFTGRGPACRWEKLVKSRARGLSSRLEAMEMVVNGICPTYRKRRQYQVPQGLEWHNAG